MTEEKNSELPPLSVGVINYNGHKGGQGPLGMTLEHLLKSDYPGELEVFVVDDVSSDDSEEFVTKTFPKVRFFRQEKNGGPNAARNRVIAEANNELIFVTDNDLEVAPDCLRLLAYELASRATAAVATPLILDYEIRDQIYSNGASLHYVCFGILPGRHQKVPEKFDTTPHSSTCGSGGIMMVKKSVNLSLDGYDNDFYFGYTDGEYTYRVTAAGHDVIQVPAAKIFHIEKPLRNPARLRFQVRGRWNLILKTYATRTLLLLSPALFVFELAQIGFLTMKGAPVEWLRGIRMVMADLPRIKEKRRRFFDLKKRPDRELLTDGEIYMFPARLGGASVLLMVKKGVEAALSLWWTIVSPLLTK